MKFVTLLIAIGLITTSIFGFAVMNHTGNMNCDPVASNSTCPPSQIGMVVHHLLSYENLLQAIVSPTTTTVLATILLIVVLAYIFTQYTLTNQDILLSRLYSRENFESSLSQYRKITRWLSLFENSPAV
jgi:uncharacterized protein YacL